MVLLQCLIRLQPQLDLEVLPLQLPALHLDLDPQVLLPGPRGLASLACIPLQHLRSSQHQASIPPQFRWSF